MKKLLLVLVGCLLIAGCMASTRTESGEASGVIRIYDRDPDTGEFVLKTEKQMSVTGPSGRTSQEGGAQAIKAGPLKFKMDGMEAEGPKYGITAEGWEGTLASPVTIMSVLGGLALIGAGVYWWLTRDVRMACIIAASGIGLFVCAFVFETYPIVILGLFLVLLAGVGFYLWERYKGRSNAEIAAQVQGVLALVTRAVEKVGEKNPEAAAAVKAAVADKAEERPDLAVKAIISEVKDD